MGKTPPQPSKIKVLYQRWRFMAFGLIFLFSCNFTRTPSSNPPSGPGSVSTSAALTVQAELTRGALNIEQSITVTPAPIIVATATPQPIEPSETPPPPPPDSCGESLPTRLTPGSEAKVVVFQVTLRTAPNLIADNVNFLARDRVVQVLSGPQCVDGSWWWQIQSEELGYGGWVVEGDDENYYLEP